MSEPDVTVEVSSQTSQTRHPTSSTPDTVVVVSESDKRRRPEIDRWVALEQRLADITSTIENMARDQDRAKSPPSKRPTPPKPHPKPSPKHRPTDFTEDEIIPKTTHRWFRPWREWAGSLQNLGVARVREVNGVLQTQKKCRPAAGCLSGTSRERHVVVGRTVSAVGDSRRSSYEPAHSRQGRNHRCVVFGMISSSVKSSACARRRLRMRLRRRWPLRWRRLRSVPGRGPCFRWWT